MIPYSEVFPLLAKALPNFQVDAEEWQGPTPYFFLSEMVEFVCQRVAMGSREDSKRFSSLIEKLIVEGDADINDLVTDAMEALWECPARNQVVEDFEPKTLERWRSFREARNF